MKAILQDAYGPAHVLYLGDVPAPELHPDDILIRNHAAGVNRGDILQRSGYYAGEHFGQNASMGLEVAGEVIRVGAKVRGFKVGDRVMAIVDGGGYAEFSRADHGLAVHIPDRLSYIEAAAVMESFVTATEAILHLAGVKPGNRILIHAAAGGTGSACVQLARALDAIVYATANGDRLADVQAIGADVPIDYRAEPFDDVVRDLTGERGVSVIIDFIGGDNLAASLNCLGFGGTLVQVANLSGKTKADLPVDQLIHKHLRILGTAMKSRTLEAKREMVRRFAKSVLPLIDCGKLVPIVDSVFALETVADAHLRIEDDGVFGKVVLRVAS